MWAVFVGILELVRILPEALLALFAGEDHLVALEEFMVFALLVTLGAVEPFTACGHNQPSSAHVFVQYQRISPLFPQLSLSVCLRVLTAPMWVVVGMLKLWFSGSRTAGGADGDLRVENVFTRNCQYTQSSCGYGTIDIRTTCCFGCVKARRRAKVN